MREPAEARRRRAVCALRDVRSDRLHAIAPTARRVEQHRSILHGASPWNEPARVFARAARQADAKAVRIRSAVQGNAVAAAGTHPACDGVLCALRASHRISTSARPAPSRRYACSPRPNTPVPEVHLLSNGRYHVMVTNAGGGSSRWKDFAITRWREDTTCDNWGTFCYLRDVASGAFWSVAHQPTLRPTENYEAIFTEGRAEFRRRDLDIETHTEIVVSPEDDIELRRVRITNRSRSRRTIEVTSYAEMVLAPPAADALHSAFSNLFVQTEIIARRAAILCTRRPRSRDEHTPISFQLMTVHGDAGAPRSKPTACNLSAAVARWQRRAHWSAAVRCRDRPDPAARRPRVLRERPAPHGSLRGQRQMIQAPQTGDVVKYSTDLPIRPRRVGRARLLTARPSLRPCASEQCSRPQPRRRGRPGRGPQGSAGFASVWLAQIFGLDALTAITVDRPRGARHRARHRGDPDLPAPPADAGHAGADHPGGDRQPARRSASACRIRS